ncbi:MAG: DNA internalization-related competence protein ComEC/Rec2 [Betaproteobacteria bacterium]
MLPLVLAAFVAGSALLQQQAALPSSAVLVALLVGAPCVAWLGWRWRPNGRARRALVLLAAGAVGFAYAGLWAQVRLADALAFADEGKDVRVVGVIASLPAHLERGQRFEFKVEQVHGEVHIPRRLSLAWYGADERVRPAERWEFTVRLRRPHGAMNPGGFDLEAWLLERDLRATGYVRDGQLDMAPRRLAERVWQAGPLVDRARDTLRDRMQAHLAGTRYGGVLIALVLGDQRAIAEEDWLLFNRTGISHLVSISGLHITMIAGLIALAASALWRRSRRLLALAPAQTVAATAGMLAALAYCLLAGWGVPAQRTFFMLATVALALLSRLALRPSLTLAAAAAVVTLLDPWAVLAPGFWLSFGAVAAILFSLASRLRAEQTWRGTLVQATHMQLAVTTALVPLTVLLFQQVSLVSPLANAVAIPLVSLVVTPLALLGGFLVMLPEPLAALAVPVLAIAHWIFALLAQGLAWVGGFGWASVALPAPPWWTLPLALAGVAWLLAPPGWPARWVGALWLLPMLLWPAQRPGLNEVWVTALDVGQGAAVLVESGDQVVLYDTGPRYSAQSDAGGRIIAPYLRWRGIGAIDLMIVSHLDSDHSGGVASLLRSLPVRRVLTSMDPTHPALVGASVERCVAGLQVRLSPLQIEVLHPLPADYARKLGGNAMSCVVVIEAAGRRLLLTGDLPARQEAELVARSGAALRASLAMAPHHGSRNSSTDALVQAMGADAVIVQAGYRNRFGHPDASVVARYEAAGGRVLRTDAGGALQWRLRIDGRDEFSAWRKHGRRYWHNQPAAAGLAHINDGSAADAANGATGYDASGVRGSPTRLRDGATHAPADEQAEAQLERQFEPKPGSD